MTEQQIAQLAASAVAPSGDVAELARAKGLLVSVEVTTWSGRRLDKRVTRDTNNRAGAGEGAGNYNKHLLGGKVPSFAAALAAGAAVRQVHYDATLPWSDTGVRLLVIGNYFEYTEKLRAAIEAFKLAVAAFLAEYPQLVRDAAARLGSMYDPSDYPTVSQIAGKFRCRVSMDPIPAAADIRVDLPDNIVRHLQRSATARVERSVSDAVRAGWDRLYADVAALRDKLQTIASDPDGKRLHASLFSNAIATADTLRRLNILDDPQLDSMADRIARELSAMDPKTIRSEPALCAGAVDSVDNILSAMAGIYGGPVTDEAGND